MKKVGKMWIVKPFLVLVFVLSALMFVIAYLYRPVLAYILLPLLVALNVFVLYRYFKLHMDIYRLLKSMGDNLNVEQEDSLFRFPMPSLVVSKRREIIWCNDAFRESFQEEDIYGSSLNRITYQTLEELQTKPGQVITHKNKHYKVYFLSSGNAEEDYCLLSFMDVTVMYNTSQEYHLSRPVVMLILVDSYEEIVKNAKESEKTQILSEVNRVLEDYIGQTTGFLIRLERDRYMAVLEQRHFETMLEDRFSILEQTKSIMTAERMPVTLSIGVASEGGTLEENQHDALQALDMALGRGGDQAALKIEGGFKFYGGVSKGVEKRTKVKSRIIASAMVELVHNCDNVLIMGHKFSDLDAVGAAIGMARGCRCLGKEVHIVLDYGKCLATSLVDYYQSHDDSDLFVSPADAMLMVRRETLLFVVDTHSPHFVESTDIYQACDNVVVIDHHRKMVEYIDKAIIFYHEPYASSASEMVAELLQYFGNTCTLSHFHAEALMAGIMLDTKNFIMRTGVRTFEAAAYLKRNGADTIEVRRLFAGSMDDYRNKTQLVAKAEVYQDCAVVCSEKEFEDIRIVAAQAADDLLGINGVNASFVLYQDNDRVNISARSMGTINVQVIMEELGGGGHQTMAASQLPDTTMVQVKERLLEAIDLYHENNAQVKA